MSLKTWYWRVLKVWLLQRLVNNAEEVAFNDPPGGTAEKLILNRHLSHMLKHARLSALQRFFQQVLAVQIWCAAACSTLWGRAVCSCSSPCPNNDIRG